MAIYTTFFLGKPEGLIGGFPGWRAPLPLPVKRKIIHPFTKKPMEIETREPEWGPEDQGAQPAMPKYQVVRIEGNYEDYLESRIPAFVQQQSHWCAKGLTEIELEPLASEFGLAPVVEMALYSPPASSAMLQRVHDGLLAKLRDLDAESLHRVAGAWAMKMSAPEFTHSVTGTRLYDGWALEDAVSILDPLTILAKSAQPEDAMYLLIEP